MMTNPVKKVPIHLQSAQNRILIKGGNVVNEDGCQQVDIYIEDCLIKQMGNHLIIPGGTRVIDATGKNVIPGGIDVNVHLQTPTKTPNGDGTVCIDNFYQGTKAAIVGGTTMVVDLAVPEDDETLEDAYVKWKGWAEDLACCDYALKVGLPGKVDESVLEQMELLTSEEFGVNTFQLNMSGRRQMETSHMMKAFEKCANLGCLAQVHAENGDIVARNEKKLLEMGIQGPEGLALAHTEAAEEEAVMRATTLANQIGCPIQINHCMSSKAADTIRFKKAKGNIIYGEITPAALACDGHEYWNKCWRHAAGFTCAPPLRKGQKDKLLEMVDTAFDLISSHHATYNAKQKAMGLHDFSKIPLGINGIESRMNILWELAVHPGKITAEKFVAMTSSVPAKMLNLFPTKGCLAVGSHADVVVWDPKATRTISESDHTLKVDFNVFEGMSCHGVAETVIVQGKVMVDEGRVRVMQGVGNFIPLSTFPTFMYKKLRAKEAEDFALASTQSVARSDEDMAIPNRLVTNNGNGDNDGDHADIPLPTPKKSDQPERAPSQHTSHFDVGSQQHQTGSDELDEPNSGNTPRATSVRIRAPPGGRSSGSFW